MLTRPRTRSSCFNVLAKIKAIFALLSSIFQVGTPKQILNSLPRGEVKAVQALPVPAFSSTPSVEICPYAGSIGAIG